MPYRPSSLPPGKGQTPLYMACEEDQSDVVEILLKNKKLAVNKSEKGIYL